MICHNNLVFSVLYRGDLRGTRELVEASAMRVGMRYVVPWDRERLRALFVLLLDRDMELKQLVIRGTSAVGPMDGRKASALFSALRPQLIQPWLSNEHRSVEELVDGARVLCLVC
jgi:hypothetical protein